MMKLSLCGPGKGAAKGDGSHPAQPNRVHGRELFHTVVAAPIKKTQRSKNLKKGKGGIEFEGSQSARK